MIIKKSYFRSKFNYINLLLMPFVLDSNKVFELNSNNLKSIVSVFQHVLGILAKLTFMFLSFRINFPISAILFVFVEYN